MDTEADLSSTKLDLLRAAERLFATQGIAATTIKQINAEAGQKNSSAIHYHFGSRDSILDAIVTLRVAPANIEREKCLKEALAATQGEPLSPETIIHLLVKPGIDRLLGRQGPHFSQRFLIQLRMNNEAWRRYQRENLVWTLNDLQAELQRSRPLIPAHILRNRFRNAVNFVMFELAEIEATEDRLGNRFNRDEAMFRMHDLQSLLSAMIDAPITPEAAGALEMTTNKNEKNYNR